MIEAKQWLLAHGLAATPEHAQTMCDILESGMSRTAAISLLWLASKKGAAFDLDRITEDEIQRAYLEVQAAELFTAPAQGRA